MTSSSVVFYWLYEYAGRRARPSPSPSKSTVTAARAAQSGWRARAGPQRPSSRSCEKESSMQPQSTQQQPQQPQTQSTQQPSNVRGGRGDRIRVIVRVRPTIPEDRRSGFFGVGVGVGGDDTTTTGCVSVPAYSGPRPGWFTGGEYAPFIRVQRGPGEKREFRFDAVLSQTTTQAMTYATVARPRVADVLAGVNASIIMYGQTGSGKSFTTFGPPDDPLVTGRISTGPVLGEHSGLVPRAIVDIFDALNAPGNLYRATLSYVQVYKDQVFDLLHGMDEERGCNTNMNTNTMNTNMNTNMNTMNPMHVLDEERRSLQPTLCPLQIREDRSGIFLSNVTCLPMRRAEDVFIALMRAGARRAVAATQMNRHSSRSHVLLSLAIERVIDGISRRGVLTIVDLAGSERVSKTLSDGERLSEAKRINQSLSALGNCVVALSAGRSFIPFRDSTLTRLLTEPLSGNSRTVIVATVGPAAQNYDETASTLLFATRCMSLRTGPIVNVNVVPVNAVGLLRGVEYDASVALTALGDAAVLEDDAHARIACVAAQCPRCGAHLTILPRSAVEAFEEAVARGEESGNGENGDGDEGKNPENAENPENANFGKIGKFGKFGDFGEDERDGDEESGYSELSANKVTTERQETEVGAETETRSSGSPARTILAEGYVRSLRETIGILEAENARQRAVLRAVRSLLRHGAEDVHVRGLLAEALDGASPERADAGLLAGVSASVATRTLLDDAEALLAAERKADFCAEFGSEIGVGANALRVTTTAPLPLVLSRTCSAVFSGRGSAIDDYLADEVDELQAEAETVEKNGEKTGEKDGENGANVSENVSESVGKSCRGGPLLISNEYVRDLRDLRDMRDDSQETVSVACRSLSPVSRAPLPVIIPKFRRA